MKFNPIDVARMFLFVREAQSQGQNKGLRVEAIQHWCGGDPGLSWCCFFVTMILDICYQGAAPIPRGGRCQDVYDLAKKKGWLVDNAQVGDIFLYVDKNDHAHHIGFVTAPGGAAGIAGNTSADGTSDNGDRVAEHSLSKSPSVKYVRFVSK